MMNSAIKEVILWLTRSLYRILPPTSRSIIVRDSISMKDLADNLPVNLLRQLLFFSCNKLGLTAIRINGRYGEIEGSPSDKGILYRYMQTGTWSPGFQKGVVDRVFASNVGTFVDVGANIGLTVIPAATKHTINCYAVEPDPRNFEFLRRNVESRKYLGRIDLFNIAAYDSEVNLDFELSAENMGDHRVRPHLGEPLTSLQQGEEARQIIKVRALPLDTILAGNELTRPLLVKVDVQGVEPMVFRGARRLLQLADCLVIEFSPYLLAIAGFGEDAFFLELRDFDYGYIVHFDKDDEEPLALDSPPLELIDLISSCRAISSNKDPDNYVDLVLIKRKDLLKIGTEASEKR